MIDLKFKYVGYEPCSVNDMYIPTARGKSRRGAFFRKSKKLIDWQSLVKQSFDEEFFYKKSYLEYITKTIVDNNLGLIFYLTITLPEDDYWNKSSHELKSRDTSNFVKSIEDSICSNIGFDDRRNIKLILEKGYNEDGTWSIDVEIKTYNIDNKINVDLKGGYINNEDQ